MLVSALPFLNDWLNEHPNRDRLDAPLFPDGNDLSEHMTYAAWTKILRRASRKAANAKRQEVTKLAQVVFREDLPEIVGSDMKTHGPFRFLEIVELPSADVKALLKRGCCLPSLSSKYPTEIKWREGNGL